MKSRRFSSAWPPLLWFLFFFAGPLLLMVAMSFATRGVYGGVEWHWSLESYRRLFDSLYGVIFLRSLVLATLTTGLCLALAFPLAWVAATLAEHWRLPLVMALALPFFVNLISRVYAIRGLVGVEGPLASLVASLPPLVGEWGLVLYGMTSTYMIFMFFPIYVALEKFDFLQIEAAQDLGASQWVVLSRVLWPQLRQPVATGAMMVFVPALGEFVIPDLLGGAKTMLAGGLVTDQFLKTRDWPFGAAIAVTLVIVMMAFQNLIRRWGGKT